MSEFGDTLVACVECGAVYVAERVTTDEALVESAAKSWKPFVGKACGSCRANATQASGAVPNLDAIFNAPSTESTWRLLKGPLRVPRK